MIALAKVARFAVFVLTFCLEVKVKAAVAAEAGDARDSFASVLLQPEGCWGEDGICAVRTKQGQKASFDLAGASLVLDQSTTLIRTAKNEIRLVAGTVWIKAKTSLKVQTEFGDFTAERGEFWASRTERRATLSSVDAVVRMEPRGSRETLEITPGLENWLGRVSTQGQARTGVPTPIVFREHLMRWARLYRGPKSEFEKEAKALHATWTEAARSAAELHKALFDRKVASIEADRARRETERRKVEARDRELREMFRQRLMGEQ